MTPENPVECYLRAERMPHVWCSGCGIGTAMNCLARALDDSGMDRDRVAVVSGIGCAGRAAGYLRLDSFHTAHGRAIPFATGLQLADPSLKVVVYSGDGDLFAIGGNHFIHAARRNVDLTVVCVNNFIYGMTGGQMGPTTPEGATATTSPLGSFEQAFNLPHLAAACGAVYVARWTVYHVVQLRRAMKEALLKHGFSFVEVISPCPTYYGRRNRLGDAVDELKAYKRRGVVKHGADTGELALEADGPIIVGKFVDRDRPTLADLMEAHRERAGKAAGRSS